jgi:plasmid maintenance system killer protein
VLFGHRAAGHRGQASRDADLFAGQDPEPRRAFPLWKAHQLTGDRKGVWSLHVTRNWRLTFRVEEGELKDVNYEDYH